MRKVLSFLLVCVMCFAATVFPQNVMADQDKDKKKGLPPGIAKKVNEIKVNEANEALKCKEGKEAKREKEKREIKKVKEEDKGFKLTRAQLATLIAQKDEGFKDYQISKELMAKVNDWAAIPPKDQKAVAYVISKGYMDEIYKSIPNGKIVFQPQKPVTGSELLLLIDMLAQEETSVELEESYEGNVRLIEVIDQNTWVVVKTETGLQTAYFTANSVPDGLKIGDFIKLKVHKTDSKIIESKLNEKTVNLLTANQSNVESDLKGFSAYGFNTYAGAILQRTVAEKWQGEAGLQVTTNGYSPWQGVNINYLGGMISGINTFSFYIKGSEGLPLRVVVYDVKNGLYPAGGTLEFKTTGKWERKTVTFTSTQASDNLALQITMNNSPLQATYYLDGLQLEKGKAATTWVLGE